MRKLWLILFFTSLSFGSFAQIFSRDSIKPLELIDTLFIDRELNNWSVRFLSNLRDVQFRFRNDENNIRYVPTDRFGFGLGVASRKIILDFNVALQLNDETQTDMLNLLGTAVFGKHVLEAFLQDFEGFYKRDEATNEKVFRTDASSLIMGVFYNQNLNSSRYSVTSLRSGLDYQRKTALSPLVGGFIIYEQLKADSALIEIDPGQPDIIRYRGMGVGASAGIGALFPLPKNLFAAFSIMPSAGFLHKIVETPEDRIAEGNPMVFILNSTATIGYNANKLYVNLTIQSNRSSTELPYNMRQNLNQFNAKLAVGYKLFRNKRAVK